MTKYYLAIDKKQGEKLNNSDRFKIIPIEEITGKETTSIWDITLFTGKYIDEFELKTYLFNNNFITSDDLTDKLTICYINPQTRKWTTCAKKCNNGSRVLFKNEAKNMDPGEFSSELLSLGLPNNKLFNYNEATKNQINNLKIIQKIGEEIAFNDYYTYDYIDTIGLYLVNYAKNAIDSGFINEKYYMYIDCLVANVAYTYNRNDYNRINPKTNKKGEVLFKERHFFELVMFYHNIKRKINNEKNIKTVVFDDYIINQNTGEIIDNVENQNTRTRKIYYGDQIKFDEI